MSETIVLELNRNNSAQGSLGLNSVYGITLAHPVTINAGDTISLRMASLDSQKAEDDTIVIGNDIGLGATFSIYDVDYSAGDKRTVDNCFNWSDTAAGNGPTYDYYAAYRGLTQLTLLSFVLEIVGYNAVGTTRVGGNNAAALQPNCGSYVVNQSLSSKPTVQQSFTCKYQYVDWSGNTQVATDTGTNATFGRLGVDYYENPINLWFATGNTIKINCDPPIQYVEGTLKLLTCGGMWVGYEAPFGYSNNAGDRAGGAFYPGIKPANTIQSWGNTTDVPVKSSQFKIQEGSEVTQAGGTSDVQLDIRTTSAVLREGTYAPTSLAIQLTQLFNASRGLQPAVGANNQILAPANPLLQRTDTDSNEDMRFRRIDFDTSAQVTFSNNNTYQYKTTTDPVPMFVGASEYAFTFSNAGVFSQDYAHMPLTNPEDTEAKQNVAIFYDTSGPLSYHLVRQASGVVFHDLQPRDFWSDVLGIADQLIVPLQTDTSGTKYYTRSAMDDKITYGYAGLGGFLEIPSNNPKRKMSTIPPPNNPVYFDVTGETRAIFGETPKTNATGGYYLIEVLGLTSRRGGYLDTVQNNPTINAIVSKQYDSNNSVTGFAESGILYQHYGEPYIIRHCDVRILDPETKKPVPDLGPNNTLFFDVVRAPPPPPPPSVQKK